MCLEYLALTTDARHVATHIRTWPEAQEHTAVNRGSPSRRRRPRRHRPSSIHRIVSIAVRQSVIKAKQSSNTRRHCR